MKTTLCYTLIFITFFTLAFVPNTFAQDTVPEYVLRVVYFVPKDREPDPNMDTKLDTMVKDIQKFYADEMERHGFGRKFFRFETDENGDAIVHQVIGKYNDADYISGNKAGSTEINDQFDTSQNIYLMVLDYSSEVLDASTTRACGRGGTNRDGGFAILPASGPCFNLVNIAHELGHAFGLQHDFRSDEYMMSYGQNRNKLSQCATEWLDVSRYFNPNGRSQYGNTSVEMLTPNFVSPPTNIRLSFEVTDPEGLHQAQLYNPFTKHPTVGIIACQSLSGQSATVEFVTDRVFDIGEIYLIVLDAHGSFTWHRFDIDTTDLLPPSEVVSIPDPNLAAAIREELDLAAGSPITALNMLGLERLIVQNKQIKDLTGLEHATSLRSLVLEQNEIEDITLLTGLKQLRWLLIHRNKIMDVTPLTQLTNLTTLNLGDNQISDVTPLAGLTQLRTLQLWNNQISDVSPLARLKNLHELNFERNQISDVSPLTGLTQLSLLVLRSNQISDVSPLVGLTQLNFLELRSNQISDISPLAGLTQLNFLELRSNQISDISPLAGLVNLERLDLIENPIKNRKPLLDLLRKNPDVEIYLTSYHKPLPVTLSHFRAELTNVGVVLKWTTESEVDNAGFNIYRSPTKDGEFKVVNPTMIQGAGTTGERNNYTWKDTTAKPNTVYYYRIKDVSHAGVHKQLATVRLRGLISASGKLAASWAGLKAQN